MTFDEVKYKISKDEFIISQHAFVESAKDRIDDVDIKDAVLNGELLEIYHQDLRGESILVSGSTGEGKPLHIVLGIALEEPVIITVYVPTQPKWISPTKRGGSSK